MILTWMEMTNGRGVARAGLENKYSGSAAAEGTALGEKNANSLIRKSDFSKNCTNNKRDKYKSIIMNETLQNL